jgi:hypothetical protein
MKHDHNFRSAAVADLIRYFRKCRADQVNAYRQAQFWPERRAARSWVLHYGRLLRKMERADG